MDTVKTAALLFAIVIFGGSARSLVASQTLT